MSRVSALRTLARPRMVPLVWMAVFFGYMLGHWEAGVHFRGGVALAVTLVAWTHLHLGTMWLNAARDRDSGPVAFGETAEVPPGTLTLGYLSLAACVLWTLPAGWVAVGCAVGTVVLSVLYSHPRTAWKGHPIGGPFVNVVGYGILTPLAGLSAARGGVGARTVGVFGAISLAMAGLYFAAQAFQEADDRARGDRTLVATHGPHAVLRAARVTTVGAGVLALLGALLGWFPLLCLLGLPWVWRVDRHLVAWRAKASGGTPQDARRLVILQLQLLAVLVAAAVTEHIWDLLHGELPAGLNTRVVPEPWFVLG